MSLDITAKRQASTNNLMYWTASGQFKLEWHSQHAATAQSVEIWPNKGFTFVIQFASFLGNSVVSNFSIKLGDVSCLLVHEPEVYERPYQKYLTLFI